jgi:hypothetical protein
MNVLLRVAMIVLLAFVGLMVGITLAPRLAREERDKGQGIREKSQPDWGGGRLSFPARELGSRGIQESGSSLNSSTHQLTNVTLRQKSGADYALTLALPSLGQPGRSGLFELPSSRHFQKQLLPGAGDAEAPAADIPLYPQSTCRLQVGHGTACFTGFYLTPDSVEAVRSFYVRVLSRLGWQRVTADRGDTMRHENRDTTGFRGENGSVPIFETFAKPNEDRTVVVQLRKQDSVTTRIGLVAMTSGNPDRNERK